MGRACDIGGEGLQGIRVRATHQRLRREVEHKIRLHVPHAGRDGGFIPHITDAMLHSRRQTELIKKRRLRRRR